MQELEVKLENLDARDMRQLNELYAEMKRVEGEFSRVMWVHPGRCILCPAVLIQQVHLCLRFDNCSQRAERGTAMSTSVPTAPATIEPSVPVLVIACNRDKYIHRTLDALLKSVALHLPSLPVTLCMCVGILQAQTQRWTLPHHRQSRLWPHPHD